MKKLILLAVMAAIFAFSPMGSISYVHAEDAYTDMEGNSDQDTQDQWVADEPTDSENYDASQDEEAPAEEGH